MDTNSNDGSAGQNGAEPIYGPAYGSVPTGQQQAGTTGEPLRRQFVDGPSPPYTAPYPPYPSDVPTPGAISTPVASGLAYFVIPAMFFLISEPYRSDPLVRFHSWQSIFYFLAVAAIDVLKMLLASMLPSNIAYSINSLFYIVLFVAWLIAVIKAFQGGKWLLPVIGSYAMQTSETISSR